MAKGSGSAGRGKFAGVMLQAQWNGARSMAQMQAKRGGDNRQYLNEMAAIEAKMRALGIRPKF